MFFLFVCGRGYIFCEVDLLPFFSFMCQIDFAINETSTNCSDALQFLMDTWLHFERWKYGEYECFVEWKKYLGDSVKRGKYHRTQNSVFNIYVLKTGGHLLQHLLIENYYQLSLWLLVTFQKHWWYKAFQDLKIQAHDALMEQTDNSSSRGKTSE